MEISIVEILLHIVNIVILFVFLRWLLYKPVAKFLSNRAAGIQKQIDEAAKMQTEAEQLKSKYDEMMANAQELASQIIDQGRSVADDQARQIVADAEGQAGELKDRAKKAIIEQKKQAVIEMRQEVTRIAVQIAEKVLEREVSYEDNQDIIDRFFEKVS
jgi:F-type H+-transporting ATPase subunit b